MTILLRLWSSFHSCFHMQFKLKTKSILFTHSHKPLRTHAHTHTLTRTQAHTHIVFERGRDRERHTSNFHLTQIIKDHSQFIIDFCLFRARQSEEKKNNWYEQLICRKNSVCNVRLQASLYLNGENFAEIIYRKWQNLMMNTIVKGVTNSVVNAAPVVVVAIITVRIDETTDADVMIGPIGKKHADSNSKSQDL